MNPLLILIVMIVDTLENASRYYMLHPAFEMAMDYLENADAGGFKPGHVELSGQDVYVNSMERLTVAEEEAVWESHDSYMDIHFMVEGSERIKYAEPDKMKISVPYNKENECTLFEGDEGLEVNVPVNGFVVFFPGEIHKAMIACGEPTVAKKMVAKIRLD